MTTTVAHPRQRAAPAAPKDVLSCIAVLGWSMRSLAAQLGVNDTVIKRACTGKSRLRDDEMLWLWERAEYAFNNPPPRVPVPVVPLAAGEAPPDLDGALRWLFWSARGFAELVGDTPKHIDKVLFGKAKLDPRLWSWLQDTVRHARENPPPRRPNWSGIEQAQVNVRRTRTVTREALAA